MSTQVETSAGSKVMDLAHALHDAMVIEMERDPNVFLMGEDVWGEDNGGVFFVSGDMYHQFGANRVRDTPISETAIMGSAVGAAMAGLRPIIEIMFVDFMGVCMDELMNQAAKLRYMTGGNVTIPLVVRTSDGAGFSAAAHHSQCLEALFAHIPGLKTVVPCTPADAKGLLATAVRDDNPVVFLEHKMLYGLEGEVPDGEYLIPFGKADVKREGSDVTIVTWSAMVHQALAAAEALAADGVSAEVVDLRSLVPLDKEAILASVAKTHRLVVAHEAVQNGGYGAEIAALVAGEGFDLLDAPIVRVAAPYTPVPFAAELEAAYLPNAEKIAAAVKGMI
jgi:acetoin:2,6-dichlorophenolindophenol oxidoreductase subunit beta